MKRTAALHVVTAFAVLSIAGQAFAKGGSTGGVQGHGGPQNMKRGGPGNSAGPGHGQKQGSVSAPAAMHLPARQ